MSGLMGFTGCSYHRNRSYDDPYSSGSESYSQDSRNQRRRFFAYLQREACLHALHSERSQLGNRAGFQSSYAGRGGCHPLMSGLHSRTPSPWGASTGSSYLGSGMDTSYMGMNTNTGLGTGDGLNNQTQSTFFRNAAMGSRPHLPFIMATSRQRRPEITNRHRHSHSPLRYSRHSPFTIHLSDEENGDGFGYRSPSTPDHSRRRRTGFTHLGRSSHLSPDSRSWAHSFDDPYDYEDDENEEDDESDFEDFYPLHYRRARY